MAQDEHPQERILIAQNPEGAASGPNTAASEKESDG